MEITIQDEERKVSIETQYVVAHEVLDEVLRLLVAYGYARQNIDDAIVALADDIQQHDNSVISEETNNF